MNSAKSLLQFHSLGKNLQSFCRFHIQHGRCSAGLPSSQDASTTTDLTEQEQEQQLKSQQALLKKRNKSQLEPHHYCLENRIAVPLDDVERDVMPLKEIRERYGRDGSGCGIDPKYLWPCKEELLLMKEADQVLFPLPLHEMMAKARQDKRDAIMFAVNRQKEIRENMKGLEKWKKSVTQKMEKKEQERVAELAKRDRLIEEVRLMLGVKISPYDEKFTEIVAQKEEEERKAEKALKKQQKQQKMIEQMKRLALGSAAKATEESEKTTEQSSGKAASGEASKEDK